MRHQFKLIVRIERGCNSNLPKADGGVIHYNMSFASARIIGAILNLNIGYSSAISTSYMAVSTGSVSRSSSTADCPSYSAQSHTFSSAAIPYSCWRYTESGVPRRPSRTMCSTSLPSSRCLNEREREIFIDQDLISAADGRRQVVSYMHCLLEIVEI
jgi:hypothetical protein